MRPAGGVLYPANDGGGGGNSGEAILKEGLIGNINSDDSDCPRLNGHMPCVLCMLGKLSMVKYVFWKFNGPSGSVWLFVSFTSKVEI